MLDILSTDLLRIITIIPVLLYASYTDIKSRRVKDEVWAIPTLIALILLTYDAYVGNTLEIGIAAALSFTIIGGAAYIIYKLRIFYGADYKAFLLIAILFPWQPTINSLPIFDVGMVYTINTILNSGEPLSSLLMYSSIHLFGFTVFVNTMIFSITYFIMNLIHNIRNNTFDISKPLRNTCARKVPVNELNNIHAQVIESPQSDNKIVKGYEFISNGLKGLSTDFFRDYEKWYSETQTVSENVKIQNVDIKLNEFVEDNDEWSMTNEREDLKYINNILEKDSVWVTPGVPFIVPITLGVISSIIFGNLVYVLLPIIL